MSFRPICHEPRCDKRAVGNLGGRWWPQCLPHAIAWAEAEAERSNGWVAALRALDVRPTQLELVR